MYQGVHDATLMETPMRRFLVFSVSRDVSIFEMTRRSVRARHSNQGCMFLVIELVFLVRSVVDTRKPMHGFLPEVISPK